MIATGWSRARLTITHHSAWMAMTAPSGSLADPRGCRRRRRRRRCRWRRGALRRVVPGQRGDPAGRAPMRDAPRARGAGGPRRRGSPAPARRRRPVSSVRPAASARRHATSTSALLPIPGGPSMRTVRPVPARHAIIAPRDVRTSSARSITRRPYSRAVGRLPGGCAGNDRAVWGRAGGAVANPGSSRGCGSGPYGAWSGDGRRGRDVASARERERDGCRVDHGTQ